MPSTGPQSNSSLRDNRAHRGTVGEFLKSEIQQGSQLSFVFAYFTVHAYEALALQLEGESPRPPVDWEAFQRARAQLDDMPDPRGGVHHVIPAKANYLVSKPTEFGKVRIRRRMAPRAHRTPPPEPRLRSQDQQQVQEYRDDLEPKFGQIEILLLGRERDVSASSKNAPPGLQVFGYEALISTARTQLDWLLAELKADYAANH